MKLPSKIVAFLLCSLAGSSALCPDEEDLYPCSCWEVDGEVDVICDGEDISQLDIERALSIMGQVEIAELTLYEIKNLGKLKGDLFSGHHIRRLKIFYCEIEALTDSEKPAFSGLEDILEELNIGDSLLGSPTLQLSHLKRLKELSLGYNQLNELEEECFPASLNQLLILMNGIKSVHDRAFANLVNLRRLTIVGNEFQTYRRSWLPETINELWHLDLFNNTLTSLPRDAFSNMPSLTNLNLENNGIRTMDQDTWETLWQRPMYAISIRGNPLVCDSNMEWMRQVKLKKSLYGTCHEPVDLSGVDLRDWISQA